MEDSELRHVFDINLFDINDLDVLLHEILKYTRELLNAEAGTIYIKEDNYLKFHVFQNDFLSYEDISKLFYSLKDFKLPLFVKNKFLAVDSFLSKKIIIIDNLCNTTDYEFSGAKEFDDKFNYKTHSIIVIPLIHPIKNEVLGVVQLLNKKENSENKYFNENDKKLLSMFSSFISLSILKAQKDTIKLEQLNEELEKTNKELEQRVKNEALDNRNKSAIIFHQSKMSSMGELIGNIAHLWKHPLNMISTLASSLKIDLEFKNFNNDNFITKLSKIIDTTKKLSGTIDDFKDFYNLETTKENFSISNCIHKSLELANIIFLENNIEVKLKLDESLIIYGLKNEFTQALLNILTNSKNALVERISLNDNRFIFIDLFEKNAKKYLIIKDNAGGILIEKDKNIFNTKTFDNNTGIGLYMTKIIIEKHTNGTIIFENVEFIFDEIIYKGAQFTIEIA
jgi:two-component system, NtrC family, C4-dicarboxylate transport sensor histidine kinase DctB